MKFLKKLKTLKNSSNIAKDCEIVNKESWRDILTKKIILSVILEHFLMIHQNNNSLTLTFNH